MKLKTSVAPLLLLAFIVSGVFNSFSQSIQKKEKDKGLKDYYKDYFTMGVAVSPQALKTEEAKLILKHFQSVTAENAMKMGRIHPVENRFVWKDADEIVNFAEQNKLKIRGHVLCWHQQTPKWLFTDSTGNDVSKEVLLKRLKDHITEVVTRYKGKIYAWDVVNEVIADEDDKFYRDSPWLRICGEEFITKAFEYAHQADPQAVLFYNDYNSEQPIKSQKIFNLVQQLKRNGVPIHGLGLQGHWNIYDDTEKDIRDALHRYTSLGVDIQITELDVSIYPSEGTPRPKKEGESDAFTKELEEKQIDFYKMAFKVLRDYEKSISGVTFWNISDRQTWLDFHPVRGRKNYPLLFDANLQPKKAYWEVVRF
jgi:endo-1,4-beta-xylanase